MNVAHFLERYRIQSAGGNATVAVKPTHTSMVGGSYCVPDEEYGEFMRQYARVINAGRTMHLTETPRREVDYGCVRIDFDFRYTTTEIQRHFTNDHLKRVAEMYRRQLRRYIAIGEPKDLHCFVFTRESPYKDDKGVVKDGFHMMFMTGVPYNAQHVIRDNIIEGLKEAHTLDDIPLSNSLDKVVDKDVIEKNNWLMYGSSKKGLQPYELIMELDQDGNEVDIESWDQEDLITHLSIRRPLPKREYLNDEVLQEVRERAPKKVRITPASQARQREIVTRILEERLVLDEPVEYIQQLVAILSDERASNYSTWFEVGACLYNISSSNKMLNIWKMFSKKCPEKYDEAGCDRVWAGYRKETLGLASLHFWARSDNRQEYERIRKTSLRAKQELTLTNPTHMNIGEFIYEIYKHQFVCVDNKTKEFYEFNGLYWKQSPGGISVVKVISHDIHARYRELANEYNQKITAMLSAGDNSSNDSAANETNKNVYSERANAAMKLANSLQQVPFINNILAACCVIFYDETFLDKLDSNPTLVGCQNGIYDLAKREFRAGRPDDFISLRVAVPYVPLNPSDPEQRAKLDTIHSFLRSILPIPEVNDFVQKLLASSLDGRCLEQLFLIFTGGGGNGKSILMEWMENILGEYADKIPSTIYTSKNSAPGQATPELANVKGKRFVSCEETEEGSTLNVAKIKEFTGGNKITTRGLFQSVKTFKPQFHAYMVCNKMPNIPPSACNDGGTWRRILVVEFMSRFVDDPKSQEYEGEQYVFKKDPTISTKLDEVKDVFFSYLLSVVYPRYASTGLEAPDAVRVRTNNYRSDNDIFFEFQRERIEIHPGSTIRLSELYSEFKEFHRAAGFTDKCPSRQQVKEYFEKKLRSPYTPRVARSGWPGFRFKNPEVDLDTPLYQDEESTPAKPKEVVPIQTEEAPMVKIRKGGSKTI